MTINQDAELLTIAEAAAVVKVGRSTVNRWLRDGRLRAYRVGPRAVRIRRGDLFGIMTPAHHVDDARKGGEPPDADRPTIRPLTDEQAARQRRALKESAALLEQMRQRRDGVPYSESWPVIREERAQRMT
ncbi:MAG: helix-turn-helix domain-containing protein [Dehalococcoidia bacterium]